MTLRSSIMPANAIQWLLIAPMALAQVRAPIGRIQTDWFDATHRITAPLAERGPESVMDAKLLSPPGAQLVRVHFRDWDLPLGTRLRLTSTATGETADMNSAALKEWGGFSPLFNGPTLLVELVCVPPHTAASATIDRACAISDADLVDPPIQNRALCGADSRVRDSTGPVARLWNNGTCTASLVLTGEHAVSAGHCGPLGDDALLEFDPPDSTAGGLRVVAPANRQFPYVEGTELSDNDWTYVPCPPPNQAQSCIENLGDDALVFRVGRNVLGQSAGIARASHMRITRFPSAPTQDAMRKWGCGVMVPAAHPFSRTMKRVDGDIDDSVNRDGGTFWLYDLDQTGGDSGGPVIVNVYNSSVGVVSFSNLNDCTNAGAYSFSDPDFALLVEQAVNASSSRFVDGDSTPVPGLSAGTIWNPALAFRSGYNSVPSGGRVLVAPGSHTTGDVVLSRPCTILAPLGGVMLTR